MNDFINSPIFEKDEIAEAADNYLKPIPREPTNRFRDFSFPRPINTSLVEQNKAGGANSRSKSGSPKIHSINTGSTSSNSSNRSSKGYTYEERSDIRSENSVESFARQISPPPLTPTRSRSRHRKSYAISVSSPEELYQPQTPKSPVHFLGPNDLLTSPTVGEITYKHQLSPNDTIQNTNEQIRKNSIGIFGSLSEFAEKNHIDLKGKVFADTNEYDKPLIDLEQVSKRE
ncbi:hypothetical protein RNJ44_03942 [Nakaseomyces bracarensis]|uniref:Uncharacterized protein n=1 Tax=Nakaseomyces bracarensis TaxID=273131 RepID=A0ABR4NYX3_9SACH